MSILGDNIRKLRLEKGLRGEDLGKQFNVTKTAVSNWESGNRKPDSDIIVKLAEYFDVTTITFLEIQI